MKGRSAATDPILVLSPEAPYPVAGGGALRTASFLEYFAARGRVHLILFAVEGDSDPRERLPDGLVERADLVRLPRHGSDFLSRCGRNAGRLLRRRPPLFDRFSQPESLEAVAKITANRRYSLALVEHFWCAGYLSLIREAAAWSVLNLHNVESALHSACARSEPFPQNWAHGRFARQALSLEKELLAGYDSIVTTSAVDSERVRAIAPDAKVAVVPNAIPLRDPVAGEEREVVAFSGNLEYHPNVSAVKFFAARIWPQLRMKFPNLVWRLIGKNEAAFRPLAASDPRIELTGPVDDAVAELASARVVVAPLLAGSGTRVKILEAWAASRAVVSSPIGAEGLPFTEETHLLLAESPDRWLKQVSRVLEDQILRNRLGANGRSAYETHCSWPAAWRALDAALAPRFPSVGAETTV